MANLRRTFCRSHGRDMWRNPRRNSWNKNPRRNCKSNTWRKKDKENPQIEIFEESQMGLLEILKFILGIFKNSGWKKKQKELQGRQEEKEEQELLNRNYWCNASIINTQIWPIFNFKKCGNMRFTETCKNLIYDAKLWDNLHNEYSKTLEKNNYLAYLTSWKFIVYFRTKTAPTLFDYLSTNPH